MPLLILAPQQGQFARMAATNKCLAQSNKSRTGDEATKMRRNIATVAAAAPRYDIGHDRITGAALLGTVGLDWAVDAIAPNPAAFTGVAGGGGGGPVADAATMQLTQAMAGFGGSSGASDSLSTVPLGADMSQQTLLTTPQHA